MAFVEDLWQARLERMRRLLPLTLLAISTTAAWLAPSAGAHRWAWNEVGIPASLLAGVLWAVFSMRYRRETASQWRLSAFFGIHTVLVAVLVWVDTSYGVFAYTGFLFAYGLGSRWRVLGFGVTALVVSAALSGSYPSRSAAEILHYLVIAAVLMGLVLNSATITVQAMEQNQERGRMIDELALANRRLEESMAENAELHAQLVARARETGVVEERQRLAGEIHDTLAQGLTGIVAQLQAAERARERPDEWMRHVTLAQSLARSGLTEARRSVRALRPEQLEDASLPEAVDGLARTWSAQSGITAAVETTGTPTRAGVDVEATLFRVAQEALSNVAKHAGASTVNLTLSYLEDALLLDVQDDGIGYEPAAGEAPTEAAEKDGGYGLINMRRRLAQVGGMLTVESTPGYGTTLNAMVPLPAPSPAQGDAR